jgi:hypothetical protein
MRWAEKAHTYTDGEPWSRYLAPRSLVPLVATAILEHWDTSPDERRECVYYLMQFIRDEEIGPMTRVSAIKALMDQDYRKASLEQAERKLGTGEQGTQTDPLIDAIRGLAAGFKGGG